MIFDFSLSAVGPITKGMSRAAVRSVLGDMPEEFRKSVGSLNTTDDFGPMCLHVYYDISDVLRGVEVFFPSQVIYSGFNLLGGGLEDLISDLRYHSVLFVEDELGLTLEGGRIALYVPGKGDELNPVVKAAYIDMS